jgi:large subunit ribosomal protein L20
MSRKFFSEKFHGVIRPNPQEGGLITLKEEKMPKVKHAVASRKRKKKVLEEAKGYWGERSKKYRRAIETLRRAYNYAYRDRRTKKRVFRSLWITRINAALSGEEISYRHFINGLKKKEIILSRDILAKIAAEHPEVFSKIVETVIK